VVYVIATFASDSENNERSEDSDVPLYMNYEGFFRNSKMFMSAFDVSHEFFLRDGKVLYGPVEDGFREYLALMKQWLGEGLIDIEFPTRTQPGAYEAYITNNRSGAWEDAHFTWQGLLAKATDPEMKLASGPYLKNTPDQTIRLWMARAASGRQSM